jgi:hypothetical protein
MTEIERRLQRIEAALGLADDLTHHRPILCVPADVPDAEAWVVAQACVCGRLDCPQRSIGMVIPGPASLQAWETAAVEFHQRRYGPR